jgi:AcrR family transcriptional regulator
MMSLTAPPRDTAADPLEARTRLILEAAYELLDEDGLEGLTIRAVLKRTGLARRAFYECFAEKDDLMLAVFTSAISLAASYYAQAMAGLANPLERLKLIVTSIVLERAPDAPRSMSGRRGAALSREHLRLAEARPADLQNALTPLIALMAQQLADGMAAGLVRRADPQRQAALVYNLVSTTVHAELLTQERTDRARRERLAEDIWEFCRRALSA